jgi:hypothetical protein
MSGKTDNVRWWRGTDLDRRGCARPAVDPHGLILPVGTGAVVHRLAIEGSGPAEAQLFDGALLL